MEGTDLPTGSRNDLELIGVSSGGNAVKVPNYLFDNAKAGEAVVLFDRGAGKPLPANTIASIPSNLTADYKYYVVISGYVNHDIVDWNYEGCHIFPTKVLRHQEGYGAGGGSNNGFLIQALYTQRGHFVPTFNDQGEMINFIVRPNSTASVRQVWGIK